MASRKRNIWNTKITGEREGESSYLGGCCEGFEVVWRDPAGARLALVEASWLAAAPQLVRSPLGPDRRYCAGLPSHLQLCSTTRDVKMSTTKSWKWNPFSEFTSSFSGIWLFSMLFKIDEHQFLWYLCISKFLQAAKTTPKCQISI